MASHLPVISPTPLRISAPFQATVELIPGAVKPPRRLSTFPTTSLRRLQQSAENNLAKRSRGHQNAAEASAWSTNGGLLGHLCLHVAAPSFDGLEPVRAAPAPTFYSVISNFSRGRPRRKSVPEVSSDLIFIFRVGWAPSC